jgi:hypothetical protein
LGVGKIGEDFLRGLGNDVLTLHHSVPRFEIGMPIPTDMPGSAAVFFLRFMMGKSHSRDKRCPQGRLRRRHDDCWRKE